jgi:hypothetical protein
VVRTLLIFFSIFETAVATTFNPVTPKELIEYSDAIFKGTFLKKKSYQIEDGSIATEMTFAVDAEIGLMSDQTNQSEVTVWYPGGRVKDKTEKIEGTPQWIPGEKAIIMAKVQKDDRLWGVSLALGTFRVIKMNQREMVINSVFPQNKSLSSWDWARWQNEIKIYKQDTIKQVDSDKYLVESQKQNNYLPKANRSDGKKRSIASLEKKSENGEYEGELNPIGLLVVLAIMGLFSGFSARKKKH